MVSKTFLWIEDCKGKSAYTFWKSFINQLRPEIVVESKKNSSELVKAVKNLKDIENKYVIIFDNSFDNLQAVMELKLLKHYADEKDNVVIVDIVCFEYILLEFRDLITWIYAPDDEFLVKRSDSIAAREKLVNSITSGEWSYKDIQEIMEYDKNIEEHNIEQLATKLLFDLTRNTGFEVSKSTIGDCWVKSCCEWKNRMENDICGLDDGRLLLFDKMKKLYEGTSLKEQLAGVGLEVSR